MGEHEARHATITRAKAAAIQAEWPALARAISRSAP
jgi:hypothetical protein